MDTWLSEELWQDTSLQHQLPDTLCFSDRNDYGGASLSSDGSTPSSRQDEGEDSFHDPVLQYINRLLMDDDMEENKCMLRECVSYHATVKSFSDILSTGRNEGEGVIRPFGEEFLNLIQQNQAERDQHDLQWMEDMLKSIGPPSNVHIEEDLGLLPSDTVTMAEAPEREISGVSPESQGKAGVLVESQGKTEMSSETQIGVSGLESKTSSDGFLMQNFLEMHPWLQELSNVDIAGTRSTLQPQSQSQFAALFDTLNAARTSKSRDAGCLDAAQDEHPQPLMNPSRSYSNSVSCSRSKRAAPGLQQGPKGSRSSSSLLFNESSSDSVSDSSEVDKVSYVQNEDLQAEVIAKFLNEGLTSLGMKARRSPHLPAASTGKTGKGARKLATTADLMNLLLSCAQAVGAGNIRRANEILREIRQDASPYGNDLQRLAHYFAEGLVARISGTGSVLYTAFTNNAPSAAKVLKGHSLFVSVCPIVKVSHFFANRAIVEAAKNASRLHIIDYGIWYGIQWPSLISALAEREGGPPFLRITGIDLPCPGSNPAERVEWAGRQLSEYAQAYGVPFDYHAVADKWENINPSSLGIRQDEVVVVHSMFRLHHLLDESVTPSNPRKMVLDNIRSMNPRLLVLGTTNGSFTSPFFMSRFKEALTSFSCMFDLLEATISSDNQERIMIEREFFGRDILNIVACEGAERVERPETYRQWQNRIQRAGFVQKPLDGSMVQDVQDIVRSRYNKNFSIDKDGSWMLLGWKGKVLNALTLWSPGR